MCDVKHHRNADRPHLTTRVYSGQIYTGEPLKKTKSYALVKVVRKNDQQKNWLPSIDRPL